MASMVAAKMRRAVHKTSQELRGAAMFRGGAPVTEAYAHLRSPLQPLIERLEAEMVTRANDITLQPRLPWTPSMGFDILRGNLSDFIQPLPSRCFSIYVTTSPDFQVELTLARKFVFPFLHRLCSILGYDLTIVELRWGLTVSDRTNGHALSSFDFSAEILRCRQASAGPSFVAMLTDKKEPISLPTVLSSADFDTLATWLSKTYPTPVQKRKKKKQFGNSFAKPKTPVEPDDSTSGSRPDTGNGSNSVDGDDDDATVFPPTPAQLFRAYYVEDTIAMPSCYRLAFHTDKFPNHLSARTSTTSHAGSPAGRSLSGTGDVTKGSSLFNVNDAINTQAIQQQPPQGHVHARHSHDNHAGGNRTAVKLEDDAAAHGAGSDDGAEERRLAHEFDAVANTVLASFIEAGEATFGKAEFYDRFKSRLNVEITEGIVNNDDRDDSSFVILKGDIQDGDAHNGYGLASESIRRVSSESSTRKAGTTEDLPTNVCLTLAEGLSHRIIQCARMGILEQNRLFEEILEHREIGLDHLTDLNGREGTVESIVTYLQSDTPEEHGLPRPLVVSGNVNIGMSTVIAAAAKASLTADSEKVKVPSVQNNGTNSLSPTPMHRVNGLVTPADTPVPTPLVSPTQSGDAAGDAGQLKYDSNWADIAKTCNKTPVILPRKVQVLRFLGTGRGSRSLRHLLSSICQQLYQGVRAAAARPLDPDDAASIEEAALPFPVVNVPTSTPELCTCLVSMLELAHKHTVGVEVLIDGIQHIASRERDDQVHWIPRLLPPGVRFVISVSSTHPSRCLQQLQQEWVPPVPPHTLSADQPSLNGAGIFVNSDDDDNDVYNLGFGSSAPAGPSVPNTPTTDIVSQPSMAPARPQSATTKEHSPHPGSVAQTPKTPKTPKTPSSSTPGTRGGVGDSATVTDQCGEVVETEIVYDKTIPVSNFVVVGPMDLDMGLVVLNSMLQTCGVTVTHEQMEVLGATFDEHRDPLFLNLASMAVQYWPPTRPFSEFPETNEGVVDFIFDSIEHRNGHMVTASVMSIIAASSYGLSFTEIDHILSLDDELVRFYTRRDGYSGMLRVPTGAWIPTLHSGCKLFRTPFVDGIQVLCFRHKLIRMVAYRRYVSDTTHARLSEFFSGKWHNTQKALNDVELPNSPTKQPGPCASTATPTKGGPVGDLGRAADSRAANVLASTPSSSTPSFESHRRSANASGSVVSPPTTDSSAIIDIDIDENRQVPGQPLTLTQAQIRSPHEVFNQRRLTEFCVQLLESKQWLKLIHSLCDIDYIEAKVRSGRTFELREELCHAVSCPHAPWGCHHANAVTNNIAAVVGVTQVHMHDGFKLLVEVQRFVLRECEAMARSPAGVLQQGFNSPEQTLMHKQAREVLIRKQRAPRERIQWVRDCCMVEYIHPCFHETHKHRGVTKVAIDVLGRSAVSCSGDSIRRWDVMTGRLCSTAFRPAIAVAIDGGVMAALEFDGKVVVWRGEDLDRCKPEVIFDAKTPATAMCMTHSASHIVASFEDNTVVIIDVSDGNVIATLDPDFDAEPNPTAVVSCVACTPDMATVLCGRTNGQIMIFRQKTKDRADGGEPIVPFAWQLLWRLELKASVTAISTGDGRRIVAGGDDKIVWVWENPSKRPLRLAAHTGVITSVATAKDTVISTGQDGTTRVWDVNEIETDKPRETIPLRCLYRRGGIEPVASVSFARNGKVFVTSSVDGVVSFWEMAAVLNHERHCTVHSASIQLVHKAQSLTSVMAIAITPDASRIVCGLSDSTVRVWEGTDKLLATMSGHTDIVWAIAISESGGIYASGSADSTVRLWNSRDFSEIRTLWGHAGPVYSVGFVDEGIVTVSEGLFADCTVRYWDSSVHYKEKQCWELNSTEGQELKSKIDSMATRLVTVPGAELPTLYCELPTKTGWQARSVLLKNAETRETIVEYPANDEVYCVSTASVEQPWVVFGCRSGRIGLLELCEGPGRTVASRMSLASRSQSRSMSRHRGTRMTTPGATSHASEVNRGDATTPDALRSRSHSHVSSASRVSKTTDRSVTSRDGADRSRDGNTGRSSRRPSYDPMASMASIGKATPASPHSSRPVSGANGEGDDGFGS